MTEKSIVALKDFSIDTQIDRQSFKAGEVGKIRFRNLLEYYIYLRKGLFRDALESDIKAAEKKAEPEPELEAEADNPEEPQPAQAAVRQRGRPSKKGSAQRDEP